MAVIPTPLLNRLLDGDTDEAKGFTTYLNYWEAFADRLVELYGDDVVAGLTQHMSTRQSFQRLNAKPFRGDNVLLRELLLGGWNSELGLHLVDAGDHRAFAQNQWNNVYAYYATSRAGLAWLFVNNNSAPTKHRKVLTGLAAFVTVTHPLLPEPWSYGCSSLAPSWQGFPTPPRPVHNLTSNGNPADLLAKALKTTRNKHVEQLLEQHTGGARAKNGQRAAIDSKLECTTLFEFLWRTRTRANYGNPSMFYVGTLDASRARRYTNSVQIVTTATMALFELLIAQRAKATLVDAATHYLSRDQSGLAAITVESRLKVLGLLT